MKSETILNGNGVLLHNFFSPTECEEIIKYAEDKGIPSGNSRSKLTLSNAKYLSALWKRALPYLDCEITISKKTPSYHRHKYIDGVWNLSNINPLLRICRYDNHQNFAIHTDQGYHVHRFNHRTLKTIMVYLNDTYEGGKTRFYNIDNDDPFYCLKAKAGDCIIFNQNIIHDGEAVIGKKYIMRTDIQYTIKSRDNNIPDKILDAIKLYDKYLLMHEEIDMLSSEEQSKPEIQQKIEDIRKIYYSALKIDDNVEKYIF